jgi:hypothetical protein
MYKVLLITICALFMSACSEKKYTVYSCPTADDAEACNEKCSQNKNLNMEYVFTTNSDSKEVLMTAFIDGKQTGSLLRKKCSIFSETKWDCSSSYGSSYNTYKLVGNIFTMYTTSSIAPPSTPNQNICAK